MNSQRVLFYSRDPGGANCVVPVFKRLEMRRDIKTVLWGKDYAIARYKEEKLKYKDVSHFQTARIFSLLQSEHPKFILTGTSYGDYSEQKLWQLARRLHIPTAAIVDQWLNYRLRFTSDTGKLITPNKILIMDEFAKREMIKLGFQREQLLVVGHPYFDLLREKAGRYQKDFSNNKLSILFICDAIEQAAHVNIGYTEKTIIVELLNALGKVQYSGKINLVIKLHPKNDLYNMRSFLKHLALPKSMSMSLTKATPLQKLLVRADLVIGMCSMGLVEAYLLNKSIMSVQIGLKKDDEFILSRRGVTQTIRTFKELVSALERFFATGKVLYRKRLPIVPHARENVVKFVFNTINRK